jgi:hypothetical protein
VRNLLLHYREAKHPPQISFSVLPPAWAPPWNRNNRTPPFHHLQQHGFENLEYGVYFHKSYPSKGKRLSRICWPFGNQGKAYQDSEKTLFAEKLTMSGSLKIHFYYQVK